MISSEITVGNKLVIDTGFVTVTPGEQVQIKLTPENFQNSGDENEDKDASLIFIFDFINVDGKDIGVEVQPIDDSTVKYEIINHQNRGLRMGGVSPRMGPIGPMEVAVMGGKKVILNYQVSSRGGGEGDDQVIDFFYSFYLGGEVDE